jgi:hypothetical protein
LDSVTLDVRTPVQEQVSHRPKVGDFWYDSLGPFLERYFVILCAVLISIATVRLVVTYNALSITTDEPDDYVSGIQYWTTHTYTFSTAHPPLSRLTQGLGPYLFGARLSDHKPGTELESIALTGDPLRTIFLARLGNLPFYWLECLTVCGLAWFAFGKPVAVLATGLFTLIPETLANAGLATTDSALAANVGASFLAVILWAQKPTWFRAALAGLFTGLAALSKLTALGFVPMCLGLALVAYLAVDWPGWRALLGMIVQRITTFAAAAAIAAFVVWAGYWFAVGPFFSARLHRTLMLPAPAFFVGIRKSFSHNSAGHGAYLLGHFSFHGWWYYFPVALAFKTPIALIVLSALGLLVCLMMRWSAVYLLPIAFIFGILLLAMRGHIDIGIRHIEPIWIGLSLLGALGLRQLLEWCDRTMFAGVAAVALVAWMAISVSLQHPDYRSYFNEFAGRAPERILVDSNYDWGQDLELLGNRLHRLGARNVALAVTYDAGSMQPRDISNEDAALLQRWYGLPPIQQVNPCAPQPGWNVVSTTVEKSLSYWPDRIFYRGPGTPVEWYEQIPPTARVGPLLLFNIPAGSTLHSSNCKAGKVS